MTEQPVSTPDLAATEKGFRADDGDEHAEKTTPLTLFFVSCRHRMLPLYISRIFRI